VHAKAHIACSQCGRTVAADDEELKSWKHGDLLAGELNDVTAEMLLCPECVAEEGAGNYEAGGAG
jgi:hypothetical protein